jgi:hypothetical protein
MKLDTGTVLWRPYLQNDKEQSRWPRRYTQVGKKAVKLQPVDVYFAFFRCQKMNPYYCAVVVYSRPDPHRGKRTAF